MQAILRWADLPGRRVGVWGAGVEGGATLRRLAAMNMRPSALVDDGPGSALRTDDGGLEALLRCDVVVKSPGISRYSPAALAVVDSGVSLVGGLGLWLEQEQGRKAVACITGTKGKSTTTAICGHLLRGLGQRCLLGGNFGQPPWDPDADVDVDYFIIETSSYQATDVTTGPPLVAVTSLSQDHLTWHEGAENYFRDKLSLCRRPGVLEVIAPSEDDELRRRAEELGPAVQWVTVPPTPGWEAVLNLPGEHNRRNAHVAQAVLQALGAPGADDPERLARAARGFQGLASRLRTVGTVAGVRFVDDSLSTNVLPTLVAVETFGLEPLALLVGGHDRGIDYRPLAAGLLSRKGPTLVLGLPDSGARITALLRTETATSTTTLEVRDCTDLDEAVRAGHSWLGGTGVLLLSPAAASFGVHRDYRERADRFAQSMRDLQHDNDA